MKPVGKPDAGNRHVRFDERGWETGRRQDVNARAHPRLYLPIFRVVPILQCGNRRRQNIDADHVNQFEPQQASHSASTPGNTVEAPEPLSRSRRLS